MNRKKINGIMLVFFSVTFIVIGILWQSNPVEVYAYNMITSQDIIDNDLLLDKTVSKLEDIKLVSSNGTTGGGDDDEEYEAVSLDDAKEIITYAPVVEKKKEKPKYFFAREHIVKEGESLWAISKTFDISPQSIVAFNKMKGTRITEGQKLQIPSIEGMMISVKKGENLKNLSARFKVSINDIVRVNRLVNSNDLRSGSQLYIPGNHSELAKIAYAIQDVQKKKIKTKAKFIWPTDIKNVTSIFGMRMHPIYQRMIFHQGIDLSGTTGTKLYSPADGRVFYRDVIRGYGKVVIIKHEEGYSSVFAHLSRYNVRMGEWVDQGEVIGYMGATGRVTGPHLHFEMRRYDRAVDPLKLLGK